MVLTLTIFSVTGSMFCSVHTVKQVVGLLTAKLCSKVTEVKQLTINCDYTAFLHVRILDRFGILLYLLIFSYWYFVYCYTVFVY